MSSGLKVFLGLTVFFAVSLQANARGQDIRIECEDEKDAQLLSELIEVIVPKALESFETINPSVGAALENRLNKRKVVIICESGDILQGMGAAADASRKFLKPYQIRIRPYEIHRLTKMDLKLTLLHELLHFAQVDNFCTADHNQAYRGGYAEEDMIYSCSFAVFPGPSYKINYKKALATCQNGGV